MVAISLADAVIGSIVFITGLVLLPLPFGTLVAWCSGRLGVKSNMPAYAAMVLGVIVAGLAAFSAMALEDYRPHHSGARTWSD
jgi:hypothetical protein